MPNVTISPNMNMPVPVVGVDPGPDWATNLNSSLTIVDNHDHSIGSGVQITPSGLNINNFLQINNNDLTQVRSLRFQPQASVFGPSTGNPLGSDLGCLYEVGVDLYYRDGNGNNVRITQSGAITGTPGSIANLLSPASATYVAGTQTFVWQQGASTAANMDMASAIIRKTTASSNGITIAAPVSLSADYTMTLLPAPPASTQALNMDTAGNMGTITYDGIGQAMTVVGADAIAASMDATGANSIGTVMGSTGANAVANSRTRASGSSVGVGGIAYSAVSGGSSTGGAVLICQCVITTSGRPVHVEISGVNGFFGAQLTGSGTIFEPVFGVTKYEIFSNVSGEIGSGVVELQLNHVSYTTSSWTQIITSPPSLSAIDFVPAGTYTYSLYASVTAKSTGALTVSAIASNCRIIAYEL